MSRTSLQDIVQALWGNLDIAASLCRFICNNAGGSIDMDVALSRANIPFGRKSQALSAIERLQDLGFLAKSDNVLTPIPQSSSFWLELASGLEGAWVCWDIMEDWRKKERPKIVVTTPGKRSLFAEFLRTDKNLYVRTCPTWEALCDLADGAGERFVVVTPFLDNKGADMVLELFRKAGSHVKKHLVLRFIHDPESRNCIRGLKLVENELKRLGVYIHDFVLTADHNVKETFHAKIVLKDRDQAYVGSANLTREHSFEVGLMVFAEAADGIARVVDKMIEVAK